jgi:hypothetical protein
MSLSTFFCFRFHHCNSAMTRDCGGEAHEKKTYRSMGGRTQPCLINLGNTTSSMLGQGITPPWGQQSSVLGIRPSPWAN